MLVSPAAIVARPVRRFLGWWLGELVAMLPTALRQWPTGGRPMVVDLAADGTAMLRAPDGRELGRLPNDGSGGLPPGVRRGARAVLMLSPDQALARTVTLPLAAEENLAEVLAFEMDRHTPFVAEDVYFDHKIVKRDATAELLVVSFVAARRGPIDAVLASAETNRLRIDKITAAAAGHGDFNLLPRRRGRPPRLSHRLTYRAAAVAALATAVYAISLPLLQQREDLATLRAAVAAARSRAAEAEAARADIDRLLTAQSFVFERRQASPTALAVIAEVTRLLPDDTWLQQFQLAGQEVNLTGHSAAASNLVRLLEASPLLGDWRFRAPVTRDARLDVERFQLSARLRRTGS